MPLGRDSVKAEVAALAATLAALRRVCDDVGGTAMDLLPVFESEDWLWLLLHWRGHQAAQDWRDGRRRPPQR